MKSIHRVSSPSLLVAVGFVLAWIAFLMLHYALLLAFGGWVGTADGFVPWSLTALALWHWTRRHLRMRPLTAPGLPRVLLVFWVIGIALGIIGIDHGGIFPGAATGAAVVYSFLPIAIVIAVILSVIVGSVRARRICPGPAASHSC